MIYGVASQRFSGFVTHVLAGVDAKGVGLTNGG